MHRTVPGALVLAAVVALFTATPVQAQSIRYFKEDQPATRDAPSGNPLLLPANASRPMSLVGVKAFRITVCAPSGQTLQAAGLIKFWLYSPHEGLWSEAETPALDLKVSRSGRCQHWGGLAVDVQSGYLLPATVGVTTSGGGQVFVRIDAQL